MDGNVLSLMEICTGSHTVEIMKEGVLTNVYMFPSPGIKTPRSSRQLVTFSVASKMPTAS